VRHFSISPRAMFDSFLTNRSMIAMLIKRDILSRYRGSMFGIVWSLLLPLSMLIINTFVYSIIFKSKWSAEGETTVAFALILFTGTLVFSLFSECMSRSCTLITSHTSYVKKVIFPIEILPFVLLGSAFFQLVVGFCMWLLFYFLSIGIPYWTAFYFPLLLIPFIAFILGFSWFFSALGVYVRDIAHAMAVIVTIFMFMTPIFYPLSAVPPALRVCFYFNPLTFLVEQTRTVLIWGRVPSFSGLALYSLVGFASAWVGFIWFQKTRQGFADVI
jgi:lipopolysaccharide transport system permease protein